MGPPNLGLPRMSQIPQDTQYSQISEFPHRDIYQSGCLGIPSLGMSQVSQNSQLLDHNCRSQLDQFLESIIIILFLGSISSTLHYYMALRVCCYLLVIIIVSLVNMRFVKALLKYLRKSRLIHQYMHLQIESTCRHDVESLVSSNPLSSTTINTSNSITQTAPGRQRLLWVFPLQPCFNHS